MAIMKTLMVPVMVVVAGIAFAPVAAADDQSYLDELSSMGLPVSDDSRATLIQLGQQTCLTAHEDPAMQPGELAMQIAEARSSYPYAKAQLVVSSALHNYCPDVSVNPGAW
jgi:hypothetical protein